MTYYLLHKDFVKVINKPMYLLHIADEPLLLFHGIISESTNIKLETLIELIKCNGKHQQVCMKVRTF